MKAIKTITSHAGLARWLATVEDTEFLVDRKVFAGIPSPYAYSPVKPVYVWNGKNVVWFETRHRRYEVFEVPADAKLEEAENA